jgi:hypothetical protein
MKVYMSWNGATEYDGWRIYSGSGAAELSYVKAVKKGASRLLLRLRRRLSICRLRLWRREGMGGGKGLGVRLWLWGKGVDVDD